MGDRLEPFALMLHRRFSGGETIAQLAAAFQIPEERVQQRIRVATNLAKREATSSGLAALNQELRSRGRR